MIFENGGEEGFVGQMVEESQRFTTRCKYVIIFHLFYVFNDNFLQDGTPRC